MTLKEKVLLDDLNKMMAAGSMVAGRISLITLPVSMRISAIPPAVSGMRRSERQYF